MDQSVTYQVTIHLLQIPQRSLVLLRYTHQTLQHYEALTTRFLPFLINIFLLNRKGITKWVEKKVGLMV